MRIHRWLPIAGGLALLFGTYLIFGLERPLAFNTPTCDRNTWPSAGNFEAETWRSSVETRVNYFSWLEVNLKARTRVQVVSLIGRPDRSETINGGGETLFYSLGVGSFSSCGERWLREMRIEFDGADNVRNVTYAQRSP